MNAHGNDYVSANTCFWLDVDSLFIRLLPTRFFFFSLLNLAAFSFSLLFCFVFCHIELLKKKNEKVKQDRN